MKREENNPPTFPTVITGRAKINSTILGQKLEYEKIRETYWVDVVDYICYIFLSISKTRVNLRCIFRSKIKVCRSVILVIFTLSV